MQMRDCGSRPVVMGDEGAVVVVIAVVVVFVAFVVFFVVVVRLPGIFPILCAQRACANLLLRLCVTKASII